MAEWKLNGNTGTNPTQDFLGTTDYQPLVIKTDGLERLRVSSDPSGEGVVMVHSNLTVDSSSGICLKANAAHPDDPGDMVFLAANGDQKARVWSHPGTAKGLHLSGSDNNPKLTIDENGNLIIGGNANINSPGRMHISGEELLYLLNKSGVTVSQAWGGNGNLTVEGDLEIGATMRSPGRMHIAGEELLYLLNKSGVIVSQAWGGNGNLTVENDLNVGNNISVNGDITLQNADVAERFEVIDPMAAEPGVVMSSMTKARLR